MSLGSPSQLGTLLIQRLDTLLGITQSQQVNLSSGARPDAVLPTERNFPGSALKNPGARPLPESPGSANRAGRARQQTATQPDTQPSGHRPSSSAPAPSIQTHLGKTAQYILQLIQQYPQPPVTQGRHSLLPAPPGPTAQSAAAQTAATAPSASMPSASAPSTAAPSGAPQIATPAVMPTAATAAELTQQLYGALRQEVQTSGLFYESLLSRHLQGQLPNDELLHQQPQNQQPENLSALVRQQLELLATGQWEWRGELWPGASLYWQLQPADDESAHPERPDADSERSWKTHLALQLPRLGELKLNVLWSPQKLRLQAQATESTLSLLRPFIPHLQERLTPWAETLEIQLQPLQNEANADEPTAQQT